MSISHIVTSPAPNTDLSANSRASLFLSTLQHYPLQSIKQDIWNQLSSSTSHQTLQAEPPEIPVFTTVSCTRRTATMFRSKLYLAIFLFTCLHLTSAIATHKMLHFKLPHTNGTSIIPNNTTATALSQSIASLPKSTATALRSTISLPHTPQRLNHHHHHAHVYKKATSAAPVSQKLVVT